MDGLDSDFLHSASKGISLWILFQEGEMRGQPSCPPESKGDLIFNRRNHQTFSFRGKNRGATSWPLSQRGGQLADSKGKSSKINFINKTFLHEIIVFEF